MLSNGLSWDLRFAREISNLQKVLPSNQGLQRECEASIQKTNKTRGASDLFGPALWTPPICPASAASRHALGWPVLRDLGCQQPHLVAKQRGRDARILDSHWNTLVRA